MDDVTRFAKELVHDLDMVAADKNIVAGIIAAGIRGATAERAARIETLEALEAVLRNTEAALKPNKGEGASFNRAYTLSRAAVQEMRDALSQGQGAGAEDQGLGTRDKGE